jgi:hypothetical protein
MREKERNDKLEPNCRKSTTDMEEPSRDIPSRENADPNRANVRIANEEPTCTKSNTDTDDASREKDLNDTLDPRCT